MSTVTPQQINPNDEISASSVNTPINQLAAVINGNIDNSNISSVDGSKIVNASVTTAKIANGAITPSKLSLGVQTDTGAGGTTTSTVYVALTDPASVTAVIGANGIAVVIMGSAQSNNTAGAFCFTSFVASGANTIAASNSYSLANKTASGNEDISASYVYVATGLTPGSTVFSLRSQVSSGTGSFGAQNITVIPL